MLLTRFFSKHILIEKKRKYQKNNLKMQGSIQEKETGQ